MSKGVELWFDNIDIPIQHYDTLEYEITPFISLVYNKTLDIEYVEYIDLVTGEEIIEEIDALEPITVNNIEITLEDLSEFFNLVAQHKAITI